MTITTSIYQEFGKKVAEEAMDGYIYKGKTLREWIDILAQQSCEDCISRENLLKAFEDKCTGECDNCSNFRKVDEKYRCRLIADFPSIIPKEKSEYEHDHEVVKAYNDGQAFILSKIRAEIEQLPINTRTNWDGCCPDINYPEIEYVDVSKKQLLEIIDKYRAESEEE